MVDLLHFQDLDPRLELLHFLRPRGPQLCAAPHERSGLEFGHAQYRRQLFDGVLVNITEHTQRVHAFSPQLLLGLLEPVLLQPDRQR